MSAFVSQTPLDQSHAGEFLDLTTWNVDFAEEFDEGLSTICNAQTGANGRLFAPADSTYGNGCNVQIAPTNTTIYNVANGDLNLKCYYTGAAWQGGMVQTMGPTGAGMNANVTGRGFSAPRGYFAARHSCMNAYGWCGPWIYSDFHQLDPSRRRVEIDALENYGGVNDGFGAHCTALVHPPSGTPAAGQALASTIQTASADVDTRRIPNLRVPNLQDGQKREFGILIDDTTIRWYCNRRELRRVAMFDEAAVSSFFLRMSMSLFSAPASPTSGQVACSIAVDWLRHYSPGAKKWINGHRLLSALLWGEGLQAQIPSGHAYASHAPLRDIPGKVVLNKLTLEHTYMEEFTPSTKGIGGFLFDLNDGSTITVASPSGIVGVGADGRSLAATATAADLSVQTTAREALTITEHNANAHNDGRQTTVNLQLKPHPVTTLCTPGAAAWSYTTAPSSTFKAALKAFIDNGRDTGFWDKLWLFHCFASTTTQADGLLNVKGTLHGRNTDANWLAGTSGSGTFNAKTGIAGNGSSFYVDLGYRMGSSGAHDPTFDIDNHAMVYHPTAKSEGSPSFGSDFFFMNPRDTSGKLSYNNMTNGVIASVTNADSTGVFQMERDSATHTAVYHTPTSGAGGALVPGTDSTTAALVYQAATSNPIRVCARKGGGDQYGTRVTGCFSFGFSMGPDLALTYGQAVAALMTACAAG